MFKKLAVFDFDGTLVNTPTKPLNWKGGFYGRKESLLPPIFPHIEDIKEQGMHFLNKKVVNAYEKSIMSPDTLTIMMTGRHMGLRWLVLKILAAYGIDPEDAVNKRAYFISNGKFGTLAGKKSTIAELLEEFPYINQIEMWEDRDEHVVEFLNMYNEIKQFRKGFLGVTVHSPPDWD